MKKKVFLLQIFLWSIVIIQANGQNDNASLQRLYTLAGKSVNYNSHVPKDDVLKLCKTEEEAARKQNDYENLFIIQLIAVNSYCNKGDIALAVNKAQEMYEEAKKLDSKLGAALSLQAIGNTYLYSDLFQKAYSAFEEAKGKLQETNHPILLIRLLIQQVHASMMLEDTRNMQRCLQEAKQELSKAKLPDNQNYAFCLQCYQALYHIAVKDKEQAKISLIKTRHLAPKDQAFIQLYYYLCTRYHDLTGEYEQALAFCDSTLAIAVKSDNMNECKNILKTKATLLAKNGEKEEACRLYDSAQAITETLNIERYSKQIDTLRVSYWVDQMEIENATAYNHFLMWIVSGASLLLLCAAWLTYLALKKNRQLILSRLELESVRKETKDSIQSKSLFLSNMSHELRTPLNAIVGFAELLASDIIEDAESKQQIGERIEQNGQLLLKLFNDVADLSALKGKDFKFVFDTCEAVLLCQNVIDTVDNVKQTAAAVYFKTSLTELSLYTDPGRLQQILINLLINATKFTPAGSITLLLEIDAEQNNAIFTIEDTGCGIPLDKQPTIFERFEKLHEGVQGAGLGLSICQLIVERVGGKIWIDSSYTEGARFVFTHPLTKQTGL